MDIEVYKVKKRRRLKGSLKFADYKTDFQMAHEGSIAQEEFLRMKNLSLYCVDISKKLVAFVESPDNIDLYRTPLYYQTQYEHAGRVYLMPFEVFFSFKSDAIKNKQSLLIYSVGRCGSTLLSKIFQNIPGVCSISEPDVYYQIRLLRMKKAIDESEAKRLINSSTMFLWRSIDLDITKLLVIKFKADVIHINRDISSAIPNSKNLFIYRNAINVVQSFDRIRGYPYTKNRWLLRFPLLSWMNNARIKFYYSRNKNLFDHYNAFTQNQSPYEIINDLGLCGIFLLEWLTKVFSYLELRKYGADTVALRYEDLIENPRKIMRSIFDYCGISNDEIDNACKAFGMDAHAGTNLARNPTPTYKLDKKDRIMITDAIKRHTVFSGPDVVLPGTINVK